MKSFPSLLLVVTFCLVSASVLQAQKSEPLLAVNNQTTEVMTSRSASASIDFTKGQTQAQFKDLQQYVATNLKYPKLAKKNSVEGVVNVLVQVSKNGEITDAKVIKSLGFGCNEAALDLVRNMPAWIPASNAGVFVKSKQVIEINFRLQ